MNEIKSFNLKLELSRQFADQSADAHGDVQRNHGGNEQKNRIGKQADYPGR